MTKKKQPENIEWIVSGRVTYSGATCIVHAKDRDEAKRIAQAGHFIGEIDIDGASLCDWDFRIAEPNVSDGN